MTDPRATGPELGASAPGEAPDEDDAKAYELIDAGVRRKLERFGPLTIDRPAPGADGFRLAPGAWEHADLRFDPGPGWSGPAWPVEPWPVQIEGLTMQVRPAKSGGLGLYPEHAANLRWLEAAVAARTGSRSGKSSSGMTDGEPGAAGPPEPSDDAAAGARAEAGEDAASGTEGVAGDDAASGAEGVAADPRGAAATALRAPRVLNLFAHTGLATLALARAGASVAHVDGARSAVAWARSNAALSGLDDRPIRWLVDDALAFVAREARRSQRYDGFVLDPPAFGRANGREWRLEDDLAGLLSACRAIAEPNTFVLLTAHSEHVDGRRLGDDLRTAFGRPGAIEVLPLELPATSGARLAFGWAARLRP